MKSMNEVKRMWKKGLAAAAIAAAFAVPAKADIVVGGTVPIINTIYAIPNTNIPVSSKVGTFQTIATLIINNNTAGGFTFDVTMAYGGFNKVGVTVLAATPAGNPFLTAQIALATTQPASSALGTGATAYATQTWTPGLAATSSTYTSGAQTTATIDYAVNVQATWAADAAMLAGYYVEHLTANLVAVM